MKIVHIKELKQGDKIYVDIAGMLIPQEVEYVDLDNNFVKCNLNVMNFYPNCNGMFVQPIN